MGAVVKGGNGIKLLFLGDIFTEADFNLKPEADYIFGNLEGPLGGKTIYPAKRMPMKKRVALRSNPRFVKKLNLSAVSLANNHIWDYGRDGFETTTKILKDWGWGFAGAGKASSNPACTKVGKYTIYLLAYSWHVWPMATSVYLDGEGAVDICRDTIKNDLQNIPNNKNTIKIVSLHWGFEHEVLPMPSQRRLAKDIIDWGANVVVGTHPHVIQGLETYKGGLIMYSLGNFLFKYAKKPNPFPEESVGIRVNSDNFTDYEIEVYNGNRTKIIKRIGKYNKMLRYNKYNEIWKTERIRKNLPGLAFGVTYKDTFDTF